MKENGVACLLLTVCIIFFCTAIPGPYPWKIFSLSLPTEYMWNTLIDYLGKEKGAQYTAPPYLTFNISAFVTKYLRVFHTILKIQSNYFSTKN